MGSDGDLNADPETGTEMSRQGEDEIWVVTKESLARNQARLAWNPSVKRGSETSMKGKC